MTSQKTWRTLWAFAGSRNFSVFVLVMSITYVLILAVFRIVFGVEERWLYIVADLLPYKVLYALFFLNLILFGIGWVPAVIRRCKLPELDERAEHPGRLDHATQVPDAGFRVEDLKQYLRRRGYRVRGAQRGRAPAEDAPRPGNVFYASRGRYSRIGNLLFHAGFLLLLVGAVSNAVYRFEGTAFLTEGSAFTGAKKEYRTTAGSSTAALPEVDFDVEKISAEFWEGRMFFTRLEGQILHRGGRDIAKLSAAARVGNAAVTIAGYGYAPMLQLKNKDGVITAKATVKLNIFNPGSEDHFYVPGYPHKIFVSFFPDHAELNGKLVNKSMNPVNPAYFLRIVRGRLPVYSGLLKPGEWADFDGLSISFPSFVKSAEFRVVRNPGNPLLWAAFIVMGLGLAWRLLWYRKEVVLWQDEAGRTWLSGHCDYFPKLHTVWLASLAEQFKGAPA